MFDKNNPMKTFNSQIDLMFMTKRVANINRFAYGRNIVAFLSVHYGSSNVSVRARPISSGRG